MHPRWGYSSVMRPLVPSGDTSPTSGMGTNMDTNEAYRILLIQQDYEGPPLCFISDGVAFLQIVLQQDVQLFHASAAFPAQSAIFPHSVASLALTSDQQLLDLGDGLGWVQALGAGAGAIHDGVAAIQTERIIQPVKTLAGVLIPAIGNPAVRLQ